MNMTLSFSKAMAASLAVFLLSASLAFAAPLSAPSNLVATAQSTSEIDLTWTDNSSKETGFEIERSTDGVNYTVVDTVSANVESYSDTALSSDTTYYYQVRPYQVKRNGSVNYGGYSNVDSDTTFSAVPSAPSNLFGFYASSTVNLAWSDNSDNEDNFSIERSTDNVNFSVISTVGANTTFTTDSAVTASTTYYYRVQATNTAGGSGYSNTTSVFVGW